MRVDANPPHTPSSTLYPLPQTLLTPAVLFPMYADHRQPLAVSMQQKGESITRFPLSYVILARLLPDANIYPLNYSGSAWLWNADLSNGLIGIPIVAPSGSLPTNHLS